MRKTKFLFGAILFVLTLSHVAQATELKNSPELNTHTPSAVPQTQTRMLSKENVDLFRFWISMDAWKSIISWTFVVMRYVGFVMIILGCLLSGAKKNNGWTRLVRYVAFIYGTTYFWFNLVVHSKGN
jgi:hypothetical protein